MDAWMLTLIILLEPNSFDYFELSLFGFKKASD